MNGKARIGVALAAMSLSTIAMALPSAKIGRAPLIDPTTAESAYPVSLDVNQTPSLGPGAPPQTEIVELARALNYDVDEIYDYVRNYVDTVFMFGAQKGSLGAIIDKSGTPFDQAKLMVDLLRQAPPGQTAKYTANYHLGQITLNGAQFAAWTQITNLQAACDLLASGGIPAQFNGATGPTACSSLSNTATVSTVTLEHIWVGIVVLATGTSYYFDPSYKPYNFTTGVNLTSAAGLTTGQALTAATTTGGYTTGVLSASGQSVAYVKSLNATALNSTLNSYATLLQSAIQSQNSVAGTPLSSAKILDLVGGREIARFTAPTGGLRQVSLPYPATSTRTWTGNIPDQFRCSLTISLTKALPATTTVAMVLNNQIVYADDTYGRKLIFQTNFAPTSFQGSLEVVDEFGHATTLGTPYSDSTNPAEANGTITIAVNHPYVADAAGSLTTAGTYMDTVYSRSLRFSTPFTIVHGWGDANRGLVDKWATRLDDALPPECAPASETCASALYPFASAGDGRREQLAASWLVQSSVAARLHAQIANSIFTHHHSIGIVAGDSEIKSTNTNVSGAPQHFIYSVGDNFDRLDIESAFSVTSLTEAAADRRAAIHAIAATMDALEGSQSAQIADLPDTTSTATRFEWGNNPPPAPVGAADDPSGVGPRAFLDFNSTNGSSQTGVQSLMLAEGQVTSTNPVSVTGQNPALVLLPAGEMQAREIAGASLINSYASAGFRVIASQETFLGPGQRAGMFDCPTAVCTWRPSLQRGGAFVATLFDPTTGDPLEIAHIAANVRDFDQSGLEAIKGGGGGTQPDQAQTFDPGTAGDVLKAKFVDRSKVLGVDMQSGEVTYESPVSLKVGPGDFPYSLTATMIWRGGLQQDNRFGPVSHIAPNAPWTTNWNNNLSISGSALQLMDKDSDIRASAGTVAAFLAMQDIYRSPVTAQREVAAVLVGSWWTHQLTGNLATVSVGADTKQFVQRFDGTWLLPGAGTFATLAQTGQRVVTGPSNSLTCGQASAGFPLSRGWDYSPVSFLVTNGHGDKQTFDYWNVDWSDSNTCAKIHGFKLDSWQFPFGVTVNLTYSNSGTQLPVLSSVSNTLGWTINFVNSGLGGFNDGTRSVVFTDPGVTNDGQTAQATETDPALNPASSYTTLNYQLLGHRYLLNSVTTPDNMSAPNVAYTYDTLERVASAQDAVSLQLGTRGPYNFYLGEGARAERLDPAGGDYSIFYDTYRRPLGYVDEIGRTTAVTHDGRGRVISYTYPEGNQEVLAYDDHNNTTSLAKNPTLGSPLAPIVVSAQWDQTWNKPTKIIDAMQNETDLFYYPQSVVGASLVQTVNQPAPDPTQPTVFPVYSYIYNNVGQLSNSTDPTSLVATNDYNANGTLLSSTLDPTGVDAFTQYTYDALANVATVTDPNSNVTEYKYDPDRRRTQVLHHNGAVTANLIAAEQTIYDQLGRVQEEDGGTSFTNTTVNTWQMTSQNSYTPTGKIKVAMDGASDPTSYTYDPMDRPVIVTDPVGRQVATVYDLAGQTLDTWRAWSSAAAPTVDTPWDPSTYAGSGPLRYGAYTYYQNGETATVIDANNNLTASTYDGFDRLLQVNFPLPVSGSLSANSADFESYTYDPNGNRKTVQKRDGQVIAYTFDNLNRQTVKHVPGTGTLDVYSEYDLAGRPIFDNFGSTTGSGISYSYDTAKRLTGETQFGRLMAYLPDPAGNRTKTTWPDGNFINYDFDAMNRMWRIRENGATTGAGVLAVYGYDALSRPMTITRGNGTVTTYSYDLASRMQTLSHDLAGASQDLSLTFGYTLASQLQTRGSSNGLYNWLPSASNAAYVPDGLNRYAQVGGATYAYDGRGNLTSDGTNTYTYDVENRLLSASGPTAVTLTYDPLGRLQQTTAGTTVTQFLYEGTNLVAEYSGAGTTASVLRRYVHGPGTDDPIVWYEGPGFTTRNSLHADERGSVIAQTDATGAAAIYTYGPYGEPTPSWTGSRFRYTGQTTIPEAQLYYYKARVYSPSLGRFLQTDPIGTKDDLNLYAYVGSDPLDRADPTGKCFEESCPFSDEKSQKIADDAHKQAGQAMNLSVSVTAKASATAGPLGGQVSATADKQTVSDGTVSVSARTNTGGIGATAQATVNINTGPSNVGDQPATVSVRAGLVGMSVSVGDKGANAQLSIGPQIGAKLDVPALNSPVSGGVQIDSTRVSIVGAQGQSGAQIVSPTSVSVGSPGLCGLGGAC
jgi:RHS repeat-associated protein